MSSRLKLNHLTFVGPDREPAGIDFGPTLTVIVGPSDTGKSYILDSIDFMLGAKELRDIDELDGYSHVLLGITIEGKKPATFTLQRPKTGGKTYLHEGDLRTLPSDQAHKVLNAKHNPDNVRNLSNFLLTEVGLSNQWVRTNGRNTTRSLSFRDLAHLCVISETNIQSDRSPVLSSGVVQNETVEKSILKLILEGVDDSGLVEAASDFDVKISRGKNEMLDKVIFELTKEAKRLPYDALQQLERLEISIQNDSSVIEQTLDRRDGVWLKRRSSTSDLAAQEDRISELDELIARFGLLSAQYESDLSRLEMVQEGGTLLSFFEPDVCILCGALREHQRHEGRGVLGAEHLEEAVAAELNKTEALLVDLRSTIAAMSEEKTSLQLELEGTQRIIVALDNDLAALDRALEPRRASLLELTSTKSMIEKGLLAQEQIRKIEGLRGTIEIADAVQSSGNSFASGDQAEKDLSESIREVLASWGMPDTATVRIDDKAELVTGGRRRSSRGKGTRALLHSAYTLGLAEYCLSKELRHPGFVLLDSPLVTYRQPDPEDEQLPVSVADSFYRYLASEFDGQSIVLENQDPPSDLTDIKLIEFTKRTASGRYGLFPATVASTMEQSG